MKQLNSSVQRHHRLLSTVHLAGLSIVTCTHTVLRGSSQQTPNNDVLMHALKTPDVLLLSGLMTGNAGYIMNVVNVFLIMASRSLKSSDDVTLRQVGYDVSKCSSTEFISVIVMLV